MAGRFVGAGGVKRSSTKGAITRRPKIFISHRHKDKDVADALLDLFQAAFRVEKGDIRCTSVQPFTLRTGDPAADELRADIGAANVVLGILTPDTKQSSYVMFELGAAWGQNIRCFPLLAKGATITDIPAPIRDWHSLQLAEKGDCRQLINDIADVAGLRRLKGFESKIDDKIDGLLRRGSGGESLGIEITKPIHAESVTGRDFVVEGCFDRKPLDGTFRVFIRQRQTFGTPGQLCWSSQGMKRIS
jgi:hypothetical protein